jgi:branched-subunit amino acid aminotransferase/4-amino-4-deoxychorismate lyase
MYASLNGQILPRTEVAISPDDRGFRFGDGVFETIPVIAGVPYLWDDHLARLHHGLEILAIPADTSHLGAHVITLIQQHGIHHGIARILVTRGSGSQGYLPTYASDATVMLEVSDTIPPIASPDAAPPLTLWRSQWRRFPPECLPNSAKLMQGMNATLARMEAATHGLCTPALSTGCLAGTMRERLMTLWGTAVQEVSCPLSELGERASGGIVMTNAVRGVVAIAGIRNPDIALNTQPILVDRFKTLIQQDIYRSHMPIRSI